MKDFKQSENWYLIVSGHFKRMFKETRPDRQDERYKSLPSWTALIHNVKKSK